MEIFRKITLTNFVIFFNDTLKIEEKASSKKNPKNEEIKFYVEGN